MTIRTRKYPSGKTKYVLDCGFVGGKRVQLVFSKKNLAEAELNRRRGIREEEGKIGLELAMSPRDRARYGKADRELRAAGVTLEEAVRLAIELKGVGSLSISRLMEDFIGSRERMGAGRERYPRQLRVSLGQFVKGLGADRAASSITREEVKGWLFGHGWAPKTVKNYAGDLRAMFNWGVRERLIPGSPAAGIELPRVVRVEEVSVLSPDECGRLLAICRDVRGPEWDPGSLSWKGEVYLYDDLMGYLVVAMFCGVRPEEVRRSTRADMDLEGGTFVVGSSVAKDARRRVVDLCPAAVEWLRLWVERRPEQAGFRPPNWRKKWDRLRQLARLWPWPSDVLRHTFATMHYGLYKNLGLLKAQMGHHENEATLHRHYRAVRLRDGRAVSEGLAREFWDRAPGNTESVPVEEMGEVL